MGHSSIVSVKTLVRAFLDYRGLILYLLRAELKGRHFQKMLGPLWWLLEPVMFAFVYFFLATVLFKYSGGENYLLLIFTSVVVWRWFSRSVDNAPNMVLSYQSVVKQTNFPILPLFYTTALLEMTYFFFGLLALFVVCLIFGIHPTLNLIYLPIVVLVQFIFTLGIMGILATIGAFYRDIGQVTWLITSIWFYLSPGIYPETLIPQTLRPIYDLNPFATILPAYRALLLEGSPPDLTRLLLWTVIFIPLMLVGLNMVESRRRRYYKVL